jgi:hypothetical protein
MFKNFIVLSTRGIFCILIFLSKSSSETRNSNGPSNSRTTSNRREETRRGTQATAKTLAGNSLQNVGKIVKSPHSVLVRQLAKFRKYDFANPIIEPPISYPIFFGAASFSVTDLMG